MQLDKSQLFIEHNFGDQKPQYRWDNNMEIKFSETRNKKLYKQLIKMNCKAIIGLGIADSEWILWCFSVQ